MKIQHIVSRIFLKGMISHKILGNPSEKFSKQGLPQGRNPLRSTLEKPPLRSTLKKLTQRRTLGKTNPVEEES